MVKVKKYDSGTPEEFLKWRLTLNEQVKNNGYDANYDNVINLAQAMLAVRSLEACLNEKRSQEANNRIHKAKTQTEHTPSQIYDFAIFELALRAFDIQSGWRDAYERQREYKIAKAHGNSLPEDEIRSIMVRAISPEWTGNFLALGKESWRFKDLEDQLNMYRQQWQADQQKQIIAKMDEKISSKSNEGKRKSNDRNHHNSNGGRSSNRQGNNSRGGRGGR
jgi:hypothetical protein